MTSIDISHTLAARSDQLNADDLTGGPIVVRIEDVRVTGEEQPVAVRISGPHKPWKPCKSMRRLLAQLMGADAARWVGRWVELYRDASVTWGGAAVGGIRVAALSGLDRPVTVTLRATRKTSTSWTVRPLEVPAEAAPLDLGAVLADQGVSREQLEGYLADQGRPMPEDPTPEQLARLAGWLQANADKVRAVRVPGEEG